MTEQNTSSRRARGGLGRGLSSLLGDLEREAPVSGVQPQPAGLRLLPVTSLSPLPGQPRRFFDETALDELAASIASRGVLQPIVARPHGKAFQIVAGERRWRAAQRARIHEVPVLVRELSDTEAMEVALVENIQRRDLTAIEEADGYRRLLNEYGHTQEALATLVGKSRSHVTNLLRLLDLPDAIQGMVADQRLTMGHARALINVPDAEGLADRIVTRGLSVRETERMARNARGEGKTDTASPKPERKVGTAGEESDAMDADLRALERQLGDVLGLHVEIAHAAEGGTISVRYSTLGQLDMVCQRLSGEQI